MSTPEPSEGERPTVCTVVRLLARAGGEPLRVVLRDNLTPEGAEALRELVAGMPLVYGVTEGWSVAVEGRLAEPSE